MEKLLFLDHFFVACLGWNDLSSLQAIHFLLVYRFRLGQAALFTAASSIIPLLNVLSRDSWILPKIAVLTFMDCKLFIKDQIISGFLSRRLTK